MQCSLQFPMGCLACCHQAEDESEASPLGTQKNCGFIQLKQSWSLFLVRFFCLALQCQNSRISLDKFFDPDPFVKKSDRFAIVAATALAAVAAAESESESKAAAWHGVAMDDISSSSNIAIIVTVTVKFDDISNNSINRNIHRTDE